MNAASIFIKGALANSLTPPPPHSEKLNKLDIDWRRRKVWFVTGADPGGIYGCPSTLK